MCASSSARASSRASSAAERSSSRGGAVDGLLAQQTELDIDALQAASGRTFTDAERDEIRTHQLRSYRWTFLVSGLQHPKFVEIVEQLTADGAHKLDQAATALSA